MGSLLRKSWGIVFTVEKRELGQWQVVADSIEAVVPRQAVARACDGEGVYRAHQWESDEEAVFFVPPWGQPEWLS
jgi:hypothetical protein